MLVFDSVKTCRLHMVSVSWTCWFLIGHTAHTTKEKKKIDGSAASAYLKFEMFVGQHISRTSPPLYTKTWVEGWILFPNIWWLYWISKYSDHNGRFKTLFLSYDWLGTLYIVECREMVWCVQIVFDLYEFRKETWENTIMNNEDALNLLETDHFLQIENTKELQKIHLVHVCAFQIIQSLAKKNISKWALTITMFASIANIKHIHTS